MKVQGCVLCEGAGGRVVFEGAKLRVIHAEEAGFPAFYRVIWREHAAEFSDLEASDRVLCMEAVTVAEQCLREHLKPAKINLAALGNMVPHLHWHVIARFAEDSHFPGSVWAPVQREVNAAQQADIASRLPAIEAAMIERLGTRSF
ncbi:HIT family protein [Variovorax sp. GB1P17]|uniref:HIT family protein n=1 Tax=Variovorax sp. GB1P17 TaxID=3443740 RepID=UPI003F4688E2